MREIFNADFPYSLHSEFGIFHALDTFNVVPGKDGAGPPMEPSRNRHIFCGHQSPADYDCLLRHYEAAPIFLEKINVRIHTTCCCGTH